MARFLALIILSISCGNAFGYPQDTIECQIDRVREVTDNVAVTLGFDRKLILIQASSCNLEIKLTSKEPSFQKLDSPVSFLFSKKGNDLRVVDFPVGQKIKSPIALRLTTPDNPASTYLWAPTLVDLSVDNKNIDNLGSSFLFGVSHHIASRYADETIDQKGINICFRNMLNDSSAGYFRSACKIKFNSRFD